MRFNTQHLLISFLLVVLNTSAAHAASNINIPFNLGKGQVLYETYCASCHGLELTGTEKGPPFLHPFYKPSHHGDAAFYRAALKGTRSHHWEFGDMPPVAGITEKEMDSILPYIRYYQKQKKLY
jgi:mono/diheme cytochrome c family protein